MATDLEFINKTEATSIVSMDVTGVFTDKYDVYKLHVSLDCDGAGYFEIRLLQADDSLANDSAYDVAILDLKSKSVGLIRLGHFGLLHLPMRSRQTA